MNYRNVRNTPKSHLKSLTLGLSRRDPPRCGKTDDLAPVYSTFSCELFLLVVRNWLCGRSEQVGVPYLAQGSWSDPLLCDSKDKDRRRFRWSFVPLETLSVEEAEVSGPSPVQIFLRPRWTMSHSHTYCLGLPNGGARGTEQVLMCPRKLQSIETVY